MSFESRVDVTVDEYFAMIAGKTGALLGAAPEIGALIAGAAPEIVATYRRFGRALGRAFQLQDDVLGIWGDESLTGKSAASDIFSKKKSLPVVYALSEPGGRAPSCGAATPGRPSARQISPSCSSLLRSRRGPRLRRAVCRAKPCKKHGRPSLRLEPGSSLPRSPPLFELLAALVGRQFLMRKVSRL